MRILFLSVRGIIADVDVPSFETQARSLLAQAQAGDVRSLARALSLVEDHAPGFAEILKACKPFGAASIRIGVTGPPGAGKSTLVDGMVRVLREQGRTVGVVAIDPSSPYTGGALLGDRIRMQGFAGDDGVFFRSLASRGATGGLAPGAADVCTVMEAAGREVVLIETVGIGQDEVEVIRLADVTVLVLVPGMGDDVQSMKAGIMEIADIFVINKSDREGTDRVESEILAMQSLGGEHTGWMPPMIRTIAVTGKGVHELMAAVAKRIAHRQQAGGVEALAEQHLKPRASNIFATGNNPRLDHLGIAVRSIAAARVFYESLGAQVSYQETIEHEQVRTAMLPLGVSRIELLEATADDSVIGRFVARRGEGLHHVALHVDDVDALFARLHRDGVRLASDAVRVGAGGHRYFFVHPSSTGGVLVEIVGDASA